MKSILRPLIGVLSLLVLPTLAGAVTHTVNQTGLNFVPSEITINAGDTVQWVWANGVHTVTSGTDLNDPAVGALFDESFTSAQPLVSFVFTEVGDQNYFCRPHLNFGMMGIVHVLAPSAVGDTRARPVAQLLPNSPNPFNPQTTIAYDLPNQTAVSLRVFDVSGRLVRVLVDGEVIAEGRNEAIWNGRDDTGRRVASGTYFYRLEAGEYSETKGMALIK